MIENLKKAWQGEGEDFKPAPERRRWHRRHFGPGLRTAAFVIFAIIVVRTAFDYSPPIRHWMMIKTLGQRLTGSDASAWDAAAKELVQVGKEAVPILLKATRDKRPEVRQIALTALLKGGFDQDVVLPALVAAMNDIDPLVRAAAAEGLGSLLLGLQRSKEKDDSKAIDEITLTLEDGLKDTDPDVRATVARTLAGAKYWPKSLVQSLHSLLNDPDRTVREAAATTLVNRGRGNDQALEVLIESLRQTSPDPDGWPALDALVKSGPESYSAMIPSLRTYLNEREPFALFRILGALQTIGPHAKELLPDLNRLLEDLQARPMFLRPRGNAFFDPTQVESVNFEAIKAAIAIEGKVSPTALAALVAVVTNAAEPQQTRVLAAKELKKADPAALAERIPALIQKYLDEQNPMLRRQGFDLLLEIDPAAIKKAMQGEPIPR